MGCRGLHCRTPSTPTVHTLGVDEIALRLGILALQIGRAPLAERLFEAAVAANPKQSRAYAGRADAYRLQGRWAEAEVLYERSLALNSQHAENHLDWARYLHARALRARAAGERAELLHQARRAYVESYQLDPERARDVCDVRIHLPGSRRGFLKGP